MDAVLTPVSVLAESPRVAIQAAPSGIASELMLRVSRNFHRPFARFQRQVYGVTDTLKRERVRLSLLCAYYVDFHYCLHCCL